MKVSEMSNEGTYFLCPDKNCRLFRDTTGRVQCEQECPHQDKLVKMIICVGCGQLIKLPGNHNVLYAEDHNCLNGSRARNFQRMSGKYSITYEMPEDDTEEVDND